MTPDEVGTRLGGTATMSGGGDHARVTVDVPVADWVTAVQRARDELGYDFFDWLSAVDELDQGFTVVTHLWSVARREGVLLRTAVPREAPAAPSIVAVYPGAAWYERETHEMFGIAARVAKIWPGAKEPGESESGAAKRTRMRPPGVPAPGEWGPE